MEKEKIDKSSFVPHSYGDSGYRDLLKRGQTQGRSIVPATPIHSMPPLLPYPMSVPIRQQRVMSGSLPSGQQHAFGTHLPVGIGGASTGPPQGSVTLSQRPLPSLKPTNISNQIQLPLPGLPTILPPSVTSSRTGSPNVTSHHNLQNDVRVNSRTGILSDPHSIRGNIQPPGPGGQHSTQATIQVIATGSVQQPHTHIPASFLNKGGINLNATSNMLKIGVNTSHSVPSPGGSITGSAFKIGIPGKTYSGSSSAILPGTTSISKSDLPDGRHVPSGPSGYNRFPTVALPNHHSLSSHPATTAAVTTQSTSIASDPARGHAGGVHYHPITGAYVFDMGVHSLHNFPHLIRPPSTTVGSLPLYPLDSQLPPPSRNSGLNTSAVPVVAVSSKGGSSQTDPLEPSRTEGLTIHGGTSFNIQTLYPNLQVSTYPTAFSSTTSATTMDTSVRPSILRKRLTDAPTTFPVHPSEKEVITSPKPPPDTGGGGGGIANMSLPSRILSPNHNDKTSENLPKPTNHSILSITSDLKNNNNNSPNCTSTIDTTATTVTTTSTISKVSASSMNVTTSLTTNVSSCSNIGEEIPKKKPRKQLIITTEDKYGTTAPINSCATDEDEEFLKANETMKDITPPKLTPSSQPVATTTSHLKNLFTSSSLSSSLTSSCSSSTTTCCIDTSTTHSRLTDHKDVQLNGLIAVTTESRVSEPVKYYIFRRRPQVGILSEYKINTKAAHNHFYRYSDVKVKDEKKTSSYDKLLNKSSLESSTGWRLYHLSSQFDDLAQLENDICESILLCKNEIPSPSLNPDTIGVDELEDDPTKGNASEDSQLRLVHELLQGNLQRCKHSIEQLQEAKQSMFNLLEHKQKYTDIRRQRKERTKLKKKGVS